MITHRCTPPMKQLVAFAYELKFEGSASFDPQLQLLSSLPFHRDSINQTLLRQPGWQTACEGIQESTKNTMAMKGLRVDRVTKQLAL